MSKAVIQFVCGIPRGMQAGSVWKRAQKIVRFAGVLPVLAAIFLFHASQGAAQQLQPIYVTKLLAGQGSVVQSTTSVTGMSGPAWNATFSYTADTATDKYGNVFFTDDTNCVIFEIAAGTGNIAQVAGVPGVCGNNGDGPALSTELSYPTTIVFDNSGNLVIADEANQAVRKLVFSPNGNTIVTIAGQLGTAGFYGDNSVAGSGTQFHSPYSASVDKYGNIAIGDEGNYRIRQINYATGLINTIAGTGVNNNTGIVPAYSNIPGAPTGNALNVGVYTPYGVAVDAAGNLYWGTYGAGSVDMYTPPPANSLAGTAGSLVYIAGEPGTVGKTYGSCTTPVSITAVTNVSGCATKSQMDNNRTAVGDMMGGVIASDEEDLMRYIINGKMTTIAGSSSGAYGQFSTVNTDTPADFLTNPSQVAPSTTIFLDVPYAVRNDWYNNLYFPNTHAYQIGEMTYNTNFPQTSVGVSSAAQSIYAQQTSGATITLKKVATGPTTEFTLGTLSGCTATGTLKTATNCIAPVTFKPAYPGLRTGQLTFTDSNNNLSPIAISGIGVAPETAFSQTAFTTLTGTGTAGNGTGQVSAPRGGVVDSAGNIYFADTGNNEIKKISAGVVSVVAGNGTQGYLGDGSAATSAELNAPAKVAVDFAGNLFIADTGNNVIREVSAATGKISTVAGNYTAGAGYSGDNGLATAAQLNAPQGVAVDPGGRVYVADTGNNAIRYFGNGGLITTIVGNGTAGYAGDGGPSGNGVLNSPTAITVDAYGDIYIADTGNDLIRVVTSTTNNLATFGNITTFAGQQGQAANNGNGNPAVEATLNTPSDVAVDAAGDVYITAGGQIFMVGADGVLNLIAGTGTTGSYSGDGTAILDTQLPAPASNIAIDGAANLYVFDTAANLVLKAPLATPSTLNLGLASPGSTGAPQVVTLNNTGNSPLTLSGLSTSSTDFTIDGSPSTACSSTATLSAGASCTISVLFTPASTDSGAVTGTLTVTDNSLNGTNVAHSIPLTANAKNVAATSLTLTATPSTLVYGGDFTVTATVTGGSSPTGTVDILVNGVPIDSPALPANGAVTVTLAANAAGSSVVEAAYNGDATNAPSSARTTVSVQPAVLNVAATNLSMASGSSVPPLTYSITGFVNGDTSGDISGVPTLAATVTADSPVGKYPITIAQGTLAAANYTFNMVPGTLTVNPPLLPASGALAIRPVPVISTIFGNGTNGDSGNNGVATSAEIMLTHGVAVDKAGNIFTAESGSHTIREINVTTGIATIVAGQAGQAGFAGDGGPATSAMLNNPYGVALDNNGNLLIADSSNEVIRRVNMTTGIITTVAGTGGTYGYSGDGGLATNALMNNPTSVASDASGNIYVAEYANDVVRRVDAKTGIISTFAGKGGPGYQGDGGPASAAYFWAPYGIKFDPAGNLLVTEYDNETVRKINMQTGIISTIAGIGGENVVYTTTPAPGQACATDSVADGCQATQATFNHPRSAVADAYGNIYVADEDNYMVRRIDPNGIISIVAGTGTSGFSGDNGPGTAGQVTYVYDLALDTAGNVLVVDPGNYRIRKLSFNQALPTTAVGSASKSQPLYLASNSAYTLAVAQLSSTEFTLGSLGCPQGTQVSAAQGCSAPFTFRPAQPGLQTAQYAVGDSNGNAAAFGLYAFGTGSTAVFYDQGTISTIAGNGNAGSTGSNGSPAASAQVNAPRGGVIDSRGYIYFADSANNIVRRISPTGGIVTVVGNGTSGYTGDGGAATSAELNAPSKVILDPAGNLYIADTGNNVIRFVNVATGKISTAAGTGTAGFSGDGGIPTAAQLNKPQGLAIDLAGFVYVADTGNSAIRIFGNGYINTLSGTGTAGYAGDGGNAYGAQLNAPQAIALDLAGDIYIADTGNDVVREITAPSNAIITFAGQKGTAANAGDGGTALAATLAAPTDLAFDAAGDLYIAAGGQIRQVNTAGFIGTIAGNGATGSYAGEAGPAANATIPSPASNLIVDSTGDVYISDTAGDRLLEVAVGAPAPLNLGTQTPGTSSAAEVVTLQNTGNNNSSTPTNQLAITGIATSAGYTVQTGASTACTTTTLLAAGQSCTVSIVFNPDVTASGTVPGTLTITDNALNDAGATQTVALTGIAAQVAATTTTVTAGASTYTYGATTTVTASVSGTGSPTGNVSFTVNDTYIGSATLVSGQAAITLPKSLSAGSAVVTATYAGDNGNGSSSASGTITITPAMLTVTAANATFIQGAAQLPDLTYSVSGFLNGDSVSSAVAGAAAETTTATLTSAVGTYPITIALGTLTANNYTFMFVNGTLTVNPVPSPTFSFTATPASLTITQGSTGALALTLTPLYGYQGTVTFSCDNLPKNVLCTFTSATATTDSAGDPVNTQVTLSSNDQPYVAGNHTAAGSSRLCLAFGLPLCLFGFALRGRSRRKWLLRTLGLFLVSLSVFGVTACTENLQSQIAAPQTAQITVTATDSKANIKQSATVTLTIQQPTVN